MQIPKIIHYFYDNVDLWKKGPNPQVRMCVCSWKKACPDYAFMLWHDRHPEFGEILRQSLFVRRAYELKLWAFVADYVRLYALHKYGGIYLDTDVQLLKNFDAFLNDGFFVSVEGDIREGENIPEPAVMGSVPGHPLLEETMKFYRSNHIFNWQNPIVPTVMKAAMRKFCGFSRIDYSSPEETRRAETFYFAAATITSFTADSAAGGTKKSGSVFIRANISAPAGILSAKRRLPKTPLPFIGTKAHGGTRTLLPVCAQA